jgi:hypothetical protein
LALGRKLAPLAVEITAAKGIDRQHQEDFEAKLEALGLNDEAEYADLSAYVEERSCLCRALFKREDYRAGSSGMEQHPQ